jgi:5-methylcytosine-specific restriction endonuclease McrA
LDELTIDNISSRTFSKILERAKVGCSLCGWNESSCDTHHIIERKHGGTNAMDNLIAVCPNCHRIIHKLKKYSKEFLVSKSFAFTLPNWKDFYKQ